MSNQDETRISPLFVVILTAMGAAILAIIIALVNGANAPSAQEQRIRRATSELDKSLQELCDANPNHSSCDR